MMKYITDTYNSPLHFTIILGPIVIKIINKTIEIILIAIIMRGIFRHISCAIIFGVFFNWKMKIMYNHVISTNTIAAILKTATFPDGETAKSAFSPSIKTKNIIKAINPNN